MTVSGIEKPVRLAEPVCELPLRDQRAAAGKGHIQLPAEPVKRILRMNKSTSSIVNTLDLLFMILSERKMSIYGKHSNASMAAKNDIQKQTCTK